MMNKQTDPKNTKTIDEDIEVWKGKYLRALADYQNLEKRIVLMRQEEMKLAAKDIILKILPVIDALEQVEMHLQDQGLGIAMKMLRDLLKTENVEKMNVLQKKFDPLEMECIEIIGDGKSDTVGEEVRPGYKINGQIIRVAQVKVGEVKKENKEQITENKIN